MFFSAVIFFQFLVIKALDPDWIRIRIGLQPQPLDPDPEKMKTDPKHCLKDPCKFKHLLGNTRVIRLRNKCCISGVPLALGGTQQAGR